MYGPFQRLLKVMSIQQQKWPINSGKWNQFMGGKNQHSITDLWHPVCETALGLTVIFLLLAVGFGIVGHSLAKFLSDPPLTASVFFCCVPYTLRVQTLALNYMF